MVFDVPRSCSRERLPESAPRDISRALLAPIRKPTNYPPEFYTTPNSRTRPVQDDEFTLPRQPISHRLRPQHKRQNEVPQGRPCRHHHPRQVCRQEGTKFRNPSPISADLQRRRRSELFFFNTLVGHWVGKEETRWTIARGGQLERGKKKKKIHCAAAANQLYGWTKRRHSFFFS